MQKLEKGLMMPRRSVLIFALSLCGVALGLAIATFVLTRSREIGETRSTVSIGGPFTLVDSTGKTVTDQTYRGKWLLVYFGYTNCADACRRYRLIVFGRYLLAILLGNLLWEFAQLPLYTVWRN